MSQAEWARSYLAELRTALGAIDRPLRQLEALRDDTQNPGPQNDGTIDQALWEQVTVAARALRHAVYELNRGQGGAGPWVV